MPPAQSQGPRPADAQGYVYLSVSPTMPGFVHLADSEEDPQRLAWSLRTMSGTTRFRTVHAVRTRDRQRLVDHFRRALEVDQIPHHADFFKLPLRFARQTLDSEAEQFSPPKDRMPARQPKPWLLGLAIALVLTLPFVLKHRKEAQPLPQSESAAAVPIQPVAKPQFRTTKI